MCPTALDLKCFSSPQVMYSSVTAQCSPSLQMFLNSESLAPFHRAVTTTGITATLILHILLISFPDLDDDDVDNCYFYCYYYWFQV